MAIDARPPWPSTHRRPAGPSAALSTQYLDLYPVPGPKQAKALSSRPGSARMPLGELSDVDNTSPRADSELLFLPSGSGGFKLRSPKVHRITRPSKLPSRLSTSTTSTTLQTPAGPQYNFWRVPKADGAPSRSRADDTLVLPLGYDEGMLRDERLEYLSSPGLTSPPSLLNAYGQEATQEHQGVLTPANSQEPLVSGPSDPQTSSTSLNRFVHPYTTSLPPFPRLPTPPPSQEPVLTPRKPSAVKQARARPSPTPPRFHSRVSLPADVEAEYAVPLRSEGPTLAGVSPNPRRKKAPRTSSPRTQAGAPNVSHHDKAGPSSLGPLSPSLSSTSQARGPVQTPYHAKSLPRAPATAPVHPSVIPQASDTSGPQRQFKTPRTGQPAASRRRATSHNPGEPSTVPDSRARSRSLTPGGSIILGSQRSLTPAARRALKGREVGILDRSLEGTEGDDELLLLPLPRDSGLTERMKRMQKDKVEQKLRGQRAEAEEKEKGRGKSLKGDRVSAAPAPATAPLAQAVGSPSGSQPPRLVSPDTGPIEADGFYQPQIGGWDSDDGDDDNDQSMEVGRDLDNDTFVHVIERKKASVPDNAPSSQRLVSPVIDSVPLQVDSSAMVATANRAEPPVQLEVSVAVDLEAPVDVVIYPSPTVEEPQGFEVRDDVPIIPDLSIDREDANESPTVELGDQTLDPEAGVWDFSFVPAEADGCPALSGPYSDQASDIEEETERVRLLSAAVHCLPDEADLNDFTPITDIPNIEDASFPVEAQLPSSGPTERVQLVISDGRPVLEDVALADVTLDAASGEWSFSTNSSVDASSQGLGKAGIQPSVEVVDHKRVPTSHQALAKGDAVSGRDADDSQFGEPVDVGAHTDPVPMGTPDSSESSRDCPTLPEDAAHTATPDGTTQRAHASLLARSSEGVTSEKRSEKILLRLVETIVKIESDDEEQEGGLQSDLEEEQETTEVEAEESEDDPRSGQAEENEEDHRFIDLDVDHDLETVDAKQSQDDPVVVVVDDASAVEVQEAPNAGPAPFAVSSVPASEASDDLCSTTPACSPGRQSQHVSTTPKGTPERSHSTGGTATSQVSTTPAGSPRAGFRSRRKTPAVYPELPARTGDAALTSPSEATATREAPLSPRPTTRASAKLSSLATKSQRDQPKLVDTEVTVPASVAIKSGSALRRSLHEELIAAATPSNPATPTASVAPADVAPTPIIQHRAEQSIVQISSLDPRAAARAAAILKLNHQYIEQGIGGPLVADGAVVSTSMARPEASEPRSRLRSRSRTRTRPFESPHFVSVDIARKLNKNELLREAELELSLTRRAEEVGVDWGGDDTELDMPGAWKSTPLKRKRPSAPPTVDLELPKKSKEDESRRPWSIEDWKALERVFRAEQQCISQRATRPLPSTPSAWFWARSSASSTRSEATSSEASAVPFDVSAVVRRFLADRVGTGTQDDGEWSEETIRLRVQALEKRTSRHGARSVRQDSSAEAQSPKKQRHTAVLSTPRRSDGRSAGATRPADATAGSVVPPSTIKRVLGRVWAPFGFKAGTLNVSTASLPALAEAPSTPSPASAVVDAEAAPTSLAMRQIDGPSRQLHLAPRQTEPAAQAQSTPVRPAVSRAAVLRGTAAPPHPLASSWIPATPPSPAAEQAGDEGSTTPTHSPPARTPSLATPASLLALTRPPVSVGRTTRSSAPAAADTDLSSSVLSMSSGRTLSLYPPLKPSLADRASALEALINTSLTSSASSASSGALGSPASPVAIPTAPGSPSVRQLAKSLGEQTGLSRSWEGREKEMQSLRRVLSARSLRESRG